MEMMRGANRTDRVVFDGLNSRFGSIDDTIDEVGVIQILRNDFDAGS